MSHAFRARNLIYVAQTPAYFFGTVAQNLRLSDPAATDEDLKAILAELGLSDWIAGLAEGLDTRIDPDVDADLLAPSVRTALAVAQALLARPAALFLDEPAGGMDPALETRLLDAIEARRGRMTCLMVTHRPAIMRRCDGVVRLRNGGVVLHKRQDDERVAS